MAAAGVPVEGPRFCGPGSGLSEKEASDVRVVPKQRSRHYFANWQLFVDARIALLGAIYF